MVARSRPMSSVLAPRTGPRAGSGIARPHTSVNRVGSPKALPPWVLSARGLAGHHYLDLNPRAPPRRTQGPRGPLESSTVGFSSLFPSLFPPAALQSTCGTRKARPVAAGDRHDSSTTLGKMPVEVPG